MESRWDHLLRIRRIWCSSTSLFAVNNVSRVLAHNRPFELSNFFQCLSLTNFVVLEYQGARGGRGGMGYGQQDSDSLNGRGNRRKQHVHRNHYDDQQQQYISNGGGGGLRNRGGYDDVHNHLAQVKVYNDAKVAKFQNHPTHAYRANNNTYYNNKAGGRAAPKVYYVAKNSTNAPSQAQQHHLLHDDED